MTDIAVLKQRLTQAEDALHRVILGESVQAVGSNNRTVTYTPADEQKLRRYIRDLRAQITPRSGAPGIPFF